MLKSNQIYKYICPCTLHYSHVTFNRDICDAKGGDEYQEQIYMWCTFLAKVMRVCVCVFTSKLTHKSTSYRTWKVSRRYDIRDNSISNKQKRGRGFTISVTNHYENFGGEGGQDLPVFIFWICQNSVKMSNITNIAIKLVEFIEKIHFPLLCKKPLVLFV